MTRIRGGPGLWILASAFAFASMGALTHAAGERCHWLVIATSRVSLMFVWAIVAARLAGARTPVFHPKTLWIRSLAGCFSLVCNFYALTRLPVADAISLTNSHPIWIIALSAIILRRPLRLSEIACVASGIAGVFLIQRPHFAEADFATLTALLSSLSTAVAMLGLNKLKAIDPRAIVAHFAGTATIVSVILLSLNNDVLTWRLFNSETIALLVGVAVAGTFGQFFLTKAYSAGSPTRVSVIGLSQVVFAIGFDLMFWNRSLSVVTLAGFALVIAPSAWLLKRSAYDPESHETTNELRVDSTSRPSEDSVTSAREARPKPSNPAART